MADPVVLAADTTKQLMTLSTAIITVGFAFAKDFAARYPNNRVFLTTGVVLHLVSCGFGIWALMAITGVAHHLAANPDGIYSFSVQVPSVLQIVSFFFGLVVMSVMILRGGTTTDDK